MGPKQDREAGERGWDAGMRRAFADEPEAAPPSVLAALEARAGQAPRIHLRDAGEEERVVKPRVGESAGRYQILGEIARGGVGVVYKARDIDLGRDVALKVLHADHEGRESLVARFVEEAQVGGQLQHPGIVPVYEIGLDEAGRPFFTMKLVKGRTLSALLSERQDAESQRQQFLRIFEQVCQTIAYAHARGVVHRDIKSANIMVGAFGEVQVLDWGFAKVLDQGGVADELAARREEAVRTVRSGPDAASGSVTGAAFGTPAYMSPEQARGDVEALDERTDVFCLGAVLCEILTGKPPYRGSNARELLKMAGEGRVADAYERLDDSGADDELVDLAKTCLQTSKAGRPHDAGELAARITNHLVTVDERARNAELAAAEERTRAVHERKAKRLTIGLAAAVLLALVAGWFSWWRDKEAVRTTDRAVLAILAEADAHASREDWDAAVESAVRAEVRLRAAEASPGTRQQAEEKLAAYRARKERHDLLTSIERIRSEEDLTPLSSEARYAEAFRAYGIDVDELSADEIGARLNAEDARTAVELALALDHWAVTIPPAPRGGRRGPGARAPRLGPGGRGRRGRRPPTQSEQWRKLLTAANQADTDKWRYKLRLAALERDHDTLATLARSLETESQPPASIILLAQVLRRSAGPDTPREDIPVLLEGYRHHPGDFWINYHLARVGARGRRGDETDWAIAERHARIAMSLRPDNPAARSVLGMVLLRRSKSAQKRAGDLDEAVGMFEAALAVAPDDLQAQIGWALVLYARGDTQEALEVVEEIRKKHPELPGPLSWMLRMEMR